MTDTRSPEGLPATEALRDGWGRLMAVDPSLGLDADDTVKILLAHGNEHGITINPDGSLTPARPPSPSTELRGRTATVAEALSDADRDLVEMVSDPTIGVIGAGFITGQPVGQRLLAIIDDLIDRLAASPPPEAQPEGVVAIGGKRWGLLGVELTGACPCTEATPPVPHGPPRLNCAWCHGSGRLATPRATLRSARLIPLEDPTGSDPEGRHAFVHLPEGKTRAAELALRQQRDPVCAAEGCGRPMSDAIHRLPTGSDPEGGGT